MCVNMWLRTHVSCSWLGGQALFMAHRRYWLVGLFWQSPFLVAPLLKPAHSEVLLE